MEYYNKCFIILPFSETTSVHDATYWDSHYSSLLKPLIENSIKIPVERSEAMRTGLLQDIIRNLIFSKVIIADITDFNANVLWELGVRQSFTNGTVIIADECVRTRIPFELSMKGMLFYPSLNSESYEKQLGDFKIKLILAIQDCLNHPDTTDSYVLETINGRSSIYQIIVHDEICRRLVALINEMESNLKLLQICSEGLHYNKTCKKGEITKYCTGRLRGNSTELLLTTRYLAQDDELYIQLEEYFEGIHRINSQLDLWQNNRETAESWLDETIIISIPTLKKLIEEVKMVQTIITKQL